MLVLALVLLQLAGAVLAAAALWHVWRARRERGSDLRPIRLQLSNIITLLFAAGFKMPKKPGWEDDFQSTQLKDSAPEVSWWRTKDKQ